MPSLTKEEISKYWEIFQQQSPSNGTLTRDQMMSVLQNSKLPNPDLERVWDLSDIDGDGKMDFEEFCIAMRLVFDHLKQPNLPIPNQLPNWLIPASKQHLLDAKQALNGVSLPTSQDIDEEETLRNDFNWYISPSERKEYEQIYSLNSDQHGQIAFNSLTELYSTLNEKVPNTDISSAWNLVNPKSEDKIDKEQCITFLHILSQRYKGIRLPRSVPASLRATFGKEKMQYDLNKTNIEVLKPTPASSSSFGENYLNKMGITKQETSEKETAKLDDDWEEARLKRELQELDEKLNKVNQVNVKDNSGTVKRELQLLLEYKQRQLNSSDTDLSAANDEVMMISEQMDALREHLRGRESALNALV